MRNAALVILASLAGMLAGCRLPEYGKRTGFDGDAFKGYQTPATEAPAPAMSVCAQTGKGFETCLPLR